MFEPQPLFLVSKEQAAYIMNLDNCSNEKLGYWFFTFTKESNNSFLLIDNTNYDAWAIDLPKNRLDDYTEENIGKVEVLKVIKIDEHGVYIESSPGIIELYHEI